MKDDYSSEESNDSFGGKVKNPNSKIKNKKKYIQDLREALEEKQKQINQMKDLMIEDEEVKINLKDKINALTDRIEELQQGFDDNLNDDEIDILLGRNNAAVDIFNEEDDSNTNPIKDVIDNTEEYKNLDFVLGGGNAMMNDYHTRVAFLRSKTCWGRFKLTLEKLYEFFIPFKADIKSLMQRYDMNVSGVFRFIRFLLCMHILISLSQAYLLINHIIVYFQALNSSTITDSTTISNVPVTNTSDVDINQDLFFCRYYIPCFLYFSRFTTEERLTYSLTFLFSSIFLFFLISNKWIWSKRMDVLNELFFNEEKQFSKTFFNIWDWNVQSKEDLDDAKKKIKNLLTIGVKEEYLKEVLKKRTYEEKFNLFVRRTIGIILSIIVLIIGGVLVFIFYLFQGYIKSQIGTSDSLSAIDIVIQLLPGIGLSFINSIFPIFFNLIVKIEKWDFNYTILSQLVWRNFFFKAFTTGIVYFLIIYYGVLANVPNFLGSTDFDFELTPSCPSNNYVNVTVTNTTTASGVSFPTELVSFTGYSNCVEDHVGLQLITNISVDFVLRIVSPFGILLFRYLYYKKYKGKTNYKKKYDLTDLSTDMLIFSMQLLLIFVFFPFISFLSPLLLLIIFKFEVYHLRKLNMKPERMTLINKSEHFIITIYTFLLIVMLIFMVYYFKLALPYKNYMNCFSDGSTYQLSYSLKSCGPYSANEPYENIIIETINNNTTLQSIYDFVNSPLALFTVILLLTTFLIYKFNDAIALRFFIDEKRKENTSSLNYSNDLISKLRAQVRYFKGTYNKKKNDKGTLSNKRKIK